MTLKHGDNLFVFYEKSKFPHHGRYSYFGNYFGTVEGFKQYINGYVFATQAIYNEYTSCDDTRIDKLDTLIYPLCFNYRQVVELYIKYLYFKYAPIEDASKKKFVNDVSHRINTAWKKVRPHIVRLLYKINSAIDITLFDEFINQIDKFDADSIRMRYPIKKDLTSVHPKSVKLDVIGLNQKMLDLFEMFRNLDCEINEVVINNNCSTSFAKDIEICYRENKDVLSSVLHLLEELSDKKKQAPPSKSLKSVMSISGIEDCEKDYTEIKNIIYEISYDSAALIALCTHFGRYIVDGRYKLATIDTEYRKDVMKALELTLSECESFISFDEKFPNEKMCYAILEKDYSLTSKWLSTALDIMNNIF